MAEELEKQQPPGVKRQRSPAYPMFSLDVAIEKAKILHSTQRRHDAHLDSALSALGFATQTGPALRSIAALDQFGLLEQMGSKNDRRVKLTDLARDIIELLPSDPRYPAAIKSAALAPKIYTHLWDRYGALLPDNATIRSHLVRDKEFNDAIVDSVIEDYRRTLDFAKLDKLAEDGIEGNDTPTDHKPEMNTSTPSAPAPKSSPPQSIVHHAMPVAAPMPTSQQLPILVGNGMVASIPFPMSEDDFELLIGTLNLWKKRLVSPTQKQISYPREAIWRNADFDRPVWIVASMGKQDGVCYYQSADGTGIPESELRFKDSH